MLLIEKVQELQAIQPPLDPTEMKRRIEEWKTSTGYKAPEATEEGKSPVVTEKSTTVATATPNVQAALGMNSEFGIGGSVSPFTNPYNQSLDDLGRNISDDLFRGGLSLEDYENQKAEYNKVKKDFESKKQAQKKGIDILESGEVNFESRVIIPRGETGFDEFTFNQVQAKIDNKEPGFENVKDVKDYVSKVPNAEIITYTQNKDFEGTVGTLDEVVIQKYDPVELNNQLGNQVWETNNEPAIQASLNEYGDSIGSSYFPTIKNSREAEKEKNDGSKAVSIPSVQNYRTDYLGSQANLQFNDVSIDNVLQDGKQFLTENELKFLELSPEEQDKEASKEGYGERLFFGDEIKNLDLDEVQESQLELFQKAKKLADTTEKDVLKQKLNNDYFKIVGLAQEIYNWDKTNSGAANDPSFFSKNGGYKDQKGFEWTEDISSLVEEIALNGRLPGYLEKLDVRAIDDEDGHPLIKAFNDAVENYKTVNRAFQLDRDPLTTEQGGFTDEFYAATVNLLGGDADPTDRQVKDNYLNWMQTNGFTPSKEALDNSLAIQVPGGGFKAPESMSQEIGATAPDLLAWMGDVYLFTRGSGNIVGKTQKWANKLATQSKRFSKIPYALPAFKTANAALGQAATFTGGSIIGQYRTGDFDLESLPSSAGFGASLAVGHSMYDPFVRFLGKSKMGRMFSPVVNALTKYTPKTYKRVSKSVGGGFGGATTYQFGGAVTGGLFDEQGNLTVSLHTQAVETIKMIIAGTFTKAIPNMRSIGKEFKSDVINAKTSGRLDLEAKESAQRLGVKVKEGGLLEKEGFEVDQENAQAELNDAFENKVNDLLKRKREGRITKEKADAEFKRLKEDYRVVDTQIAVNAAYELIQAEKNAGNAPRESEFYLVSQKIKNGEKLNDRDGEVLSYYGLDGVGMLYKRLGIQKNSVNDSYLQNLILNESLIEAQLNGKSFMLTPYGLQPLNPVEFVSPKGTTARQNAREFLLKKQELNERIYRLKNLDKTNLSESELLENKEAIKNAEQELSKYIKGGELYNNIQSEIQGAAITAYEKDVKQADPSEGIVVEARTPEEFQKRYDESGFKAEDVKDKIAFTDKDGNKVINREFALEQRNFTPVTHEIPHSILKDSFKDAEGNVTPEGIEMIDGVLGKLTPRQKQVLDQELASRYDVGQSKEKWYEENITVLAELIKRGEIEFNKSFGEGLAGLVPAFKSFLPNIEVNPETGKGIFDMLKAQDLGRVEIKETPKKVEVETTTEKLELATPSGRFSLAKKDSDTVNRLFSEKGKDASFEILELLRPTAIGLANRFNNRPASEGSNKTLAEDSNQKQLLIEEIMTGKRGMLDVINDYAAKVERGEKVGELSLFLNNSFSTKTGFKRYVEIADRNLGKEFGQSVDDLGGLKDVVQDRKSSKKEDTTTSEVAKKPTETTRFNENYISKEFKEVNDTSKKGIEDKITETVTESFKDRPVKNFKETGKIPQALAKLYADMFGIKTVNALIEKQRNLQKLDEPGAIRARQFLIDNAASDFARLPKVKDDLGKATGIFQTKLGKVMYNKDGKLVGTLKQYKDIIQGKEITLPDYNGNEITFNARDAQGKKKPIYRDSQHITAALDFHIRNRALETLIPQQGKRIQLGAKFSLTTKKDLKWKETDEDIKTTFEVKGKKYTTRLEETAFMEFDKGQTYSDIDNIAKKLGIQKDSEGYDISSSENFYHLEFADKDGRMDITGAGNAAEVFSVNINGVVDYLKQNPKVEGVIFTAKEASRIRLYKTLAQAMASKLGGSFGFENDTFIVTNKKILSPTSNAKFSKDKKRFTSEDLQKINTKGYSEPAISLTKIEKLSSKGFKKVYNVVDTTSPEYKKMTKDFKSFFKFYPEGQRYVEQSMTGGDRKAFGTISVFEKLFGKSNRENKAIRFGYAANKTYLPAKVAKKLRDGTLLEENEFKLKELENFYLKVQEFLKTKEGKGSYRIFEQFARESSKDQGHIHRFMAPLVFYPINPLTGKGVSVKIKEEHMAPVNKIGLQLLAAARRGNIKQEFARIRATYGQGALRWNDDLALRMDLTADLPPEYYDKVIQALKEGKLDFLPQGTASLIRYTIDNTIDPFAYAFTKTQKSIGEFFVGKSKKVTTPFEILENSKVVNELITKVLTGEITRERAKKDYQELQKVVDPKAKSAEKMNDLASSSFRFDKAATNEAVVENLRAADAALELSRSLNIENGKPVPKKEKKIRVFDFDDTLARSNSKVLVEMPGRPIDIEMLDIAARRIFKKEFENKPSSKQNFKNLNEEQQARVLKDFPSGETFKINATEFAKRAAELESKGAKFDFSEFSKVVDGKKGPLFDVAKTIADKRGTEDLFVLTARPQDAAGPIKEFMKALGIDIPLKNITGLADGKASAKGRWIMDKVSEGYNDFYFADDALKNVEAVKEVLDQADVKGKVQQARFSNAKTFNTITNEMIEASSGIEAYKTFSAAKAKTLGENKGRFDWLTMASSAEDFKGLLYKMIGKGKQGEAHFKFLKTNLIDPYNRAEDSAIQAKISAANDFVALKSMYKTIPTTLKKQTGVGKFTYQHALRTYMWTKQGMSIPGLSKADVAKLNKFVTDSAELQTFADQLIVSQKGKMYPEPGKDWLAGNLTTDIIGGINKVNRAEYQKTFRENVDIIFSPENLNKMEAAYGTRWRKALEDTLRRMKSGSNRPIGGSEISNKVLDWTNNSVGATMFLNTRSALLQTISAVNFLNWGDNNPIAAGKAFANQKQFWGDFMTLMNSDYLVQRRNGLKINVSESEIADAVKDSKNKVNAAISYLLSKGFVFTRYADSFAIASGGSTFYRNRIKKYVKEGMDQKLAEEKAFNDFKDVAEESQQSSDASKISMQQASGAGRVILNWANTPMQYVRIQKRAAQDLIAGRGDAKTHISKIAYYGAIQNLIFNSLQQALFAIGFGSDEDEKDPKIKARNEKKITRVANGMIDSQLKGLGIAGNAMVAAKNTILKIIEESDKKRPEYESAAVEALSFSPAISSKYRKIVGGLKSFSWNAKEMKQKGFSLDNPAYLAGAQIFTATTNIPLDRVVKKTNNIRGILSEQTAEWQKLSLAAGYGTYDVGLPYYGGWDKPIEPTPAELKKQEIQVMKRDTNTSDQVQMLLDLGLDKKQIKALRYEDARVKKIIELQNKKKDAK